MDNLFDFINDPTHTTVISKDEWIKRAKQIFTRISNGFSESHYYSVVSDEQIPEEGICEVCKGCGITRDGKECIMDKIEGCCFTSNFDHDQFHESWDGQMGDIFELMSIENTI